MRETPLVQRLRKKKTGISKHDPAWLLVKEKEDVGLDMRRKEERRWIIALSFLDGNQYVYFNSDSHRLVELGRRQGRMMVVDNRLTPRWKRQVNDLIKTNPKVSTVPGTNEEEDINAAKFGDRWIKWFWQQRQVKRTLRLLGGWIYSTGNGYLVDRWNGRLGNEVIDSQSGKIVYEGDVELECYSPFEVLTSSRTETDHHRNAFMHLKKWRELDWLVGEYPKKGKEITAEERDANEYGFMYTGLFGNDAPVVMGAYEHKVFIKPNVDYPKGKMLCAANGIILEEDDYPYDYYPIEHFKDIDIPGVYYGRATMYDAVPLQVMWNKMMTSLYEYNDFMAKGKWLVPKGAAMEIVPDNTHGEQIRYNHQQGMKPEHLTLKGLPSTYDRLLGIIASSMDDIFSQHEVSRGTNKSDIRSGEMVSILREQDAHGSIGTHAIFEESLQRVMSRVLKRVSQGYKQNRMLKIYGREGEFEVLAFKGSDLRDNTDIHIVKQSSIADSRIARENVILRKYELGLYGDPTDPQVRREVMNMMEDVAVKDQFSMEIIDEKLAKWENGQILKGQNAQINLYDDHVIHLREHDRKRKSVDHQKLRIQKPDKFDLMENAFEAHCGSHRKILAEQVQQMIEQQGGKDGAV